MPNRYQQVGTYKSRGNMGVKKTYTKVSMQRRRPVTLSSRYYKQAASKESGYVDLAIAQYNADTTGTITLIATIPQGATQVTRVGKKVMLKSLMFRGHCNASTATTVAVATQIVVYDRRPTGALPAITDVLNSISSQSMNNDNNSGRFLILKREDKVLSGNVTTPATGLEIQNVDWWLSLRGLPAVYNSAGTGAIADIEEGALYQITVGSVAAGTGAAAYNGAFRTRYVDV